MNDSLPNMDEVVRQFEEIKTYDDSWWLRYLSEKTIFDTDNIKAQKQFLIESLGLLIEEREQDKAEIERLNGRLKWMEQIDMDRQADFELHAKSLRNSAIKVAEQDKEIQALKDQNTVLDDKLNELESSLDICTRCEMTIIQE